NHPQVAGIKNRHLASIRHAIERLGIIANQDATKTCGAAIVEILLDYNLKNPGIKARNALHHSTRPKGLRLADSQAAVCRGKGLSRSLQETKKRGEISHCCSRPACSLSVACGIAAVRDAQLKAPP